MDNRKNFPSLGMFAAVLVAFIFPFFTFSCQNIELFTMSGYDLALGVDKEVNQASNPFAGMMEDSATKAASANTETTENDPNVYALGALVLAVVGVGASLAGGRGAALGGAIAGALGALCLVILRSNVAGAFNEAMKEQQGSGGSGGAEADQLLGAMGEMFKVEMKSGWWLALLLFAAAAVYNVMRYTRKPAPTYSASMPPAQPSPYSGSGVA